MQIRTGCPTGCKYISGDKCIASECPYQTGGVHYDIRMNTFYKTATADEIDDFLRWAVAHNYATYSGENIVIYDSANAVEKYKIEKGVKSQKPIDT